MEKREGKRTFSTIRHMILLSMVAGQRTINEVSSITSINWKTVDNHLIYLLGKGLVKEVFSSDYVRIFELTEKGTRYIDFRFGKDVELDKFVEMTNSDNHGKSDLIDDGEIKL